MDFGLRIVAEDTPIAASNLSNSPIYCERRRQAPSQRETKAGAEGVHLTKIFFAYYCKDVQNLTIDAANWPVLSQLLDVALDLPASERWAWFDAVAPENGELKERLRDLLSRVEAGTGPLWGTLPGAELTLSTWPGGAEALSPGQTIGPYELKRELGHGGMGTVWLAKRGDGLLSCPVALKLPHGTWRAGALAARMAREREILAGLTHSNIARLYDTGLTADGRPFLVLEYVEGIRIDEYCERVRLDIEGRLRLFLQVVEAVAYAHAHLVVHRDLKPSNILVTEDGQARLLDFGIAKLLEQSEAAETEFTQASGRAMTPDYASPEQILGRPIGTASDVYSLGVILYELLAGTRPYTLGRGSPQALEKAILGADPPAPSKAATDPSRKKALIRDLDRIIGKAMAKDSGNRYGSAAALHADIHRYLRHEPVEAGSPSTAYRFRKFVRRHRIGVIAAAAVFCLLLAGIAGITAGLIRARQAEAHARAESATAERVSGFLADLFEASAPEKAKGRALTARDLLDRGATRVRAELANEPQVQARLLRMIGYVYTNLGLYDEARPILEEAVRLARGLGNRGLPELADALGSLGNLRRQTGDMKRAEAELRESLAVAGSANASDRIDIGPTLNSLAMLLRTREPEEALRLYQRAYDVAKGALGYENGDAGVVLANIGSIHTWQRRFSQARGNLERALALVEKFHGAGDHRLGGIYGNLAVVYKELGEYDRALAMSRRDLELSTRALGAGHPIIGTIWLNMARITERTGDPEKALRQVEKALVVLGAKLDDSHALRLTAENSRASYLMQLGRDAEARSVLDNSLTKTAQSTEAKKALSTARLTYSELQRRSGEYSESLALADAVLTDPSASNDPFLEAQARWAKAYAHASQRSWAEAEKERRKALELWQKLADENRALGIFFDAKYYACVGDAAHSVDLLRKAVDLHFRDASRLRDPAFRSVRQHGGFTAIAAALGSGTP